MEELQSFLKLTLMGQIVIGQVHIKSSRLRASCKSHKHQQTIPGWCLFLACFEGFLFSAWSLATDTQVDWGQLSTFCLTLKKPLVVLSCLVLSVGRLGLAIWQMPDRPQGHYHHHVGKIFVGRSIWLTPYSQLIRSDWGLHSTKNCQ